MFLYKMHGIGNDFVILDCRDGKKISQIAAKEIADKDPGLKNHSLIKKCVLAEYNDKIEKLN